MGSDESHFNVSLIVRDKVTRQCPQTTTFEEREEPKRIRTEVPLLTSLTPYRWAKPVHIHQRVASCSYMGVAINPFTAPAYTKFGLKDAGTPIQTKYFPVL